MRNQGRIVVSISAVLAVLLAVLLVVTVAQTHTLRPVEKIRFSQYAAEPDFDSRTFAVTDQSKIQAFESLVHTYHVDLNRFETNSAAGCAGGTKSDVELFFWPESGGGSQKIVLYDCGAGSGHDNFVAKATALLTSWR